MKTSVVAVLFWIMSGCVRRGAEMNKIRDPIDIAKVFDSFTYIGSYPSSRLLRVPESQLSYGGAPAKAKNGIAFVYRNTSNKSFRELAQLDLPRHLKEQGFTVEAKPWSNVTKYSITNDGESFVIVFTRGQCAGLLFGQRDGLDERFVLQLELDSSCPD